MEGKKGTVFRNLPGEEDDGIIKKKLGERCCSVLDVTYGAVVGKLEQTLFSWLL